MPKDSRDSADFMLIHPFEVRVFTRSSSVYSWFENFIGNSVKKAKGRGLRG